MKCDYCDAIEYMTARRHCPIHREFPPPISGTADLDRELRLAAERVTLEFATKSARRLDAGKEPFENSPLFGGPAQKELF